MDYKLTDLIDIDNTRQMLENFSSAVGVPAAIIDLEGTVLVTSPWQRVCADFHRQNEVTSRRCIESDTVLANELLEGKTFSLYRCFNGLTDAASPIVIEGEHLANAFIGQFFIENPDLGFFRRQAKEFGFNESAYLDALSEVSIVAKDTLPSILSFLTSFAAMIARLGLKHLKQLEIEKELREAQQHLAIQNRQLQDREEDLNRAQAVARIGSWRMDVQRNILHWSDETYRMFGIPKSVSMTYEAFLAAVHPDDREMVDQSWQTALRSGHYDIEHRIVVGGTIRWVHEQAELEFDENGALRGGFGTVQNITERKGMEEELRHLNRTLRALSNSIQATIHAEDESNLLDAVCRIIVEDCGHPMVWIGFAEDDENKTVGPVAQAGFEEGYLETIKITWSDTELGRGPTGTAIRTGAPDVCRNMLTESRMQPWREQAIKRGYASSVALPLMADGRILGALTIYSKEPDSFSGDEVKLLAELAGDLAYGITALRLRLVHEQSEKKLRESRARLDLALRSAGMGAWHWDINENRRYFNDHACNLLGIASTMFTGAAEEFFNVVHPDDRETIRAALSRTIEKNVPYETEYRAVWPDGSVRYITARGRLVHDDEGRPVRLNGLIWDTTERKRMEEELSKSRHELELRVEERTGELKTYMAKLEESNQALQDFASIAAHDMNEPLRKVTSFGNMLRKNYKDSLGETGNDYLNRMIDATKRMQSLLKGLLEYSRVTMKADPFVEVELSKIIGEVLSDLEVRIKRTGGEVLVGELPIIKADSTQMRQLFQNLIGNSLKFHKQGEKPVVEVRSSVADGKLQIVVKDNGIGFEEQYLEKIFGPFQRLHGRSSQYEGTGMGLAICKKIVERHGGSIVAMSAPGIGASFIVQLPMGSTRRR